MVTGVDGQVLGIDYTLTFAAVLYLPLENNFRIRQNMAYTRQRLVFRVRT